MVGDILQNDLKTFVLEWNEHAIRKNSLSNTPHGCPNDIYDIPSLFGKFFYKNLGLI